MKWTRQHLDKAGIDPILFKHFLILVTPLVVAAFFHSIVGAFLYLIGMLMGSLFWSGWGHREDEDESHN